MQYLLHDLLALPLEDRLKLIEQVLSNTELPGSAERLCSLNLLIGEMKTQLPAGVSRTPVRVSVVPGQQQKR